MTRAMRVMRVAMPAAVLTAGMTLAAWSSDSQAAKPEPVSALNAAGVAVIHPTEGHHVHGIVRFIPVSGGLRITADLQGLVPDSSHGFHIHQYGDCTAADGSSAGGHYNPENQPHAGPDAIHHHAGDLGNVRADAEGEAHLDMTVKDLTVDRASNPVIGRAVIVHEKADDLKSQPTGAAGARIGCGVIGLTTSQ